MASVELKRGVEVVQVKLQGWLDQAVKAACDSKALANEASREGDIAKRLPLEEQSHEKLMEITQSSYERARIEEARQHTYLTSFVEPVRQDQAEYPRRVRTICLVAVLALVVWMITLILVAAVKDHKLVSSGYSG